ncbi:MAG: response regulator transcription factor [Sphaerochaeta sp.]
MNPIKLLIVDNQILIREGLASLLSLRKEVEVLGTAKDGLAAIKLTESYKPDIILMDIRMPVMDGITALIKIKKLHKNIPIIMLTTFDDDEYILKSLQNGAAGYLLKDIPTDDLVRALQQVANGTFQAAESVIQRLANILNNDNNSYSKDKNLELLKECYNELSEKEKTIFKSLGLGKTNKEIAIQMNLTEGTIKNYMTNILASFDMRDRTQLALLAFKMGYGN